MVARVFIFDFLFKTNGKKGDLDEDESHTMFKVPSQELRDLLTSVF